MSQVQQRRPVVRSIGAVFAGLIAVIVITTATDLVLHATGVFPQLGQPMSDSLFGVATAYRIIYGIAGGYITAWLAPDRPAFHALILGLIGLLLSIIGAVATWNAGPAFGPKWYPLTLVVIAIPTAWLGGKLYEMQRKESQN
jgi:hypothetical protein